MGKIRIMHFYKSFNVYNGLIEILTILARGMDLDRFDLGVIVFDYRGNEFGDRFEKLGGRIYSLGVQDRWPYQARAIFELRTFLERNRPHILQTYALKANLFGVHAAKRARVPAVIASEMTLKDIAHTPITRFRDRCLHPLVSTMLRSCDCFMVTSEYIKGQWYSAEHASKFRVIYPPFNAEKYEEATLTAGNGPAQRGARQVIGYIGRLSEEKGLQVLLHAVARVQNEVADVALLIVGKGPFEASLRRLARRLGLDGIVEFAGFSENVFRILRAIDLLVIPSRTEGAPMVAIEAMSMGLPVVATRVGGVPELVTDGVTGYLVAPGDSEALTRSIVRVLRDPVRSRQLGAEGKRRAFARFHPSLFIHQMEQMYLDLHARKAPAAESAAS